LPRSILLGESLNYAENYPACRQSSVIAVQAGLPSRSDEMACGRIALVPCTSCGRARRAPNRTREVFSGVKTFWGASLLQRSLARRCESGGVADLNR
jgi:hypothetical protein